MFFFFIMDTHCAINRVPAIIIICIQPVHSFIFTKYWTFGCWYVPDKKLHRRHHFLMRFARENENRDGPWWSGLYCHFTSSCYLLVELNNNVQQHLDATPEIHQICCWCRKRPETKTVGEEAEEYEVWSNFQFFFFFLLKGYWVSWFKHKLNCLTIKFPSGTLDET